MKLSKHAGLDLIFVAALAAGLLTLAHYSRNFRPSPPLGIGAPTNAPAWALSTRDAQNAPAATALPVPSAPPSRAALRPEGLQTAAPLREAAARGRPPSGLARARTTLPALQLTKQWLDLTDEQANKLAPLFEDQQAKVAALRANTALSRQERMAKFTEIRRATDEKIRTCLTAEQAQKWRSMRLGQQQPATQSPPPRFGTAEQLQGLKKSLADQQPPGSPDQPTISPAAPPQDPSATTR